jgi:hypothetical protein
MAQLSPTTIYLSQAARLIALLQRRYGTVQNKTQDEIVEVFNMAITEFEQNAGKSMTKFEPIVRSEPPSSTKMNRFWTSLDADTAILEDQIELLRAAVIDLFNSFTVEIKKAQEDARMSQNKIKTLELYSSVSDPSLLQFGDNFITEEYIDWDAQSTGENRVQLLGNGTVALGIDSRENVLDTTSTKISILEGSNGFLGNNQEIVEPMFTIAIAPGEPNPGQVTTHKFKHETSNPNNIASLTDSKPNTWLEFEKYWIDPADINAASNYNFNYKLVNAPEWNYLRPYVKANDTVNWADGFNENGTGDLILNLELDLRTPKKVNLIELLPFGLQDNVNNPILVKSVSVSLDKTVWYELSPKSAYLANGIDRRITDVDAAQIYVGKGVWAAPGELIRFVKFEIAQQLPVTTNIGHHYYLPKTPDPNKPLTRVIGPIPPVDDIDLYTGAKNLGDSSIVQKTEAFIGKRWAIGIRDIYVGSNIYHETSSFVSKKFDAGGVIDRVALDAEVEIPSDYDSNTNWVKFYVSPNDGTNWFQISRIQDDFLDIPEIIAFNDPTPIAMREPGVAYREVAGTVNSIRLKVEIDRPANKENSTPILHPYKIKIKRRV